MFRLRLFVVLHTRLQQSDATAAMFPLRHTDFSQILPCSYLTHHSALGRYILRNPHKVVKWITKMVMEDNLWSYAAKDLKYKKWARTVKIGSSLLWVWEEALVTCSLVWSSQETSVIPAGFKSTTSTFTWPKTYHLKQHHYQFSNTAYTKRETVLLYVTAIQIFLRLSLWERHNILIEPSRINCYQTMLVTESSCRGNTDLLSFK
jgi:hypothetical protein